MVKRARWRPFLIIMIYIIIRDCTRVGAFPRPFCVPNSVGTRFTYPSGRVLGHSLVPIRITVRVIPLKKKLFRCAFARSWLTAFVFTRWSPGRHHTRALRPNGWTQLDQSVHSLIARAAPHSRASAKRLDPAWSNLARGREGRGGEWGEGRGGDCPHFPQTRTFVTAEPSRPPAKRGDRLVYYITIIIIILYSIDVV